MKTQHFTRILAGIALLALVACNTEGHRLTTPSGDPDEGRYHEKSFSWSEASGPLAKGGALTKLSSKETRFSTQEEMVAAVQALEVKLDDQAFTDSLWKPVDYACDELDLAVWNEYGTVWLGDSVVFDEGVLRGRCRLSEDIMVIGKPSDELDSSLFKITVIPGIYDPTGSQPPYPTEVSDRQYPYKMIGRSWRNDYYGIYKSTGGYTQFEKRRSRFGVTSWYDTDASRIGIRTYIIDCSAYQPRECQVHKSLSDWDSNDDYVSEREPVMGGEIRNYYPKPDNGYTTIQEIYYPVNFAKKFKVADAAMSMHSANHAGLIFRAMSSYGIDDSPLHPGNFFSYDYVTW